MKRFRVESRDKTDRNHKLTVNCSEKDLDYWKALCKYDAIEINGECYFRKFPITKNKKNYYAKDNMNMTKEELELIKERLG